MEGIITVTKVDCLRQCAIMLRICFGPGYNAAIADLNSEQVSPASGTKLASVIRFEACTD